MKLGEKYLEPIDLGPEILERVRPVGAGPWAGPRENHPPFVMNADPIRVEIGVGPVAGR